MKITSILLIEDDAVIAEFMRVILEKEQQSVQIATNGKKGIELFHSWQPEIVLLDLGLPDMDGLEVMKEIRKTSPTPIIVISARGLETDKVTALDAGADDYLTKPFGTSELLARIRTALRHAEGTALLTNKQQIENGELRIDLNKQEIYLQKEKVHVTPIEFKIIQLLGENLGKVLTHQFISRKIWGPYIDETKTLRVNMSNIRRKLEKNPMEPQYIVTEVGIGYRMIEQ